MKEYIKPDIDIVELRIEEVIASGEISGPGDIWS